MRGGSELAKSANLRPLIPPSGVEPHYIPSAKLAAFVRARDLTLPGAGLRSRGKRMRPRPHHSVSRRRSHPRVEPEVCVPYPLPTE
jgi:hypothetical protein